MDIEEKILWERLLRKPSRLLPILFDVDDVHTHRHRHLPVRKARLEVSRVADT